MKASKETLTAAYEDDDISIREAVWGNTHVSWETYNKAFDVGPLLKGLPNDLDQCPHHGFVFRGKMTISYEDGASEEIAAGETYYIRPGHTTVLEAGTEVLEFSPNEEFKVTMDAVMRNMG